MTPIIFYTEVPLIVESLDTGYAEEQVGFEFEEASIDNKTVTILWSLELQYVTTGVTGYVLTAIAQDVPLDLTVKEKNTGEVHTIKYMISIEKTLDKTYSGHSLKSLVRAVVNNKTLGLVFG